MNDKEKEEQEKIHKRAVILAYVFGAIMFYVLFIWNR